MKGMLVSMCIIVTPFTLLLLPTPLWPKAVIFTVGLFSFSALWGGIDAFLHQFAVDFSNRAYDEARSGQLGLYSLSLLSDDSVKILNMWWYMRMGGMVIAGIIVSFFIPTVSSLTGITGQMQGTMQSAAQQAGTSAFTPGGAANTINSQTVGPTTALTNAGKYGLEGMVGSSLYNSQKQINTNLGIAEQLSGGDASKAAAITGALSAANQSGIASQDIAGAKRLGFVSNMGLQHESLLRQEMQDYEQWKRGNQVLTESMAHNLGIDGKYAGMKLDFQQDAQTGELKNINLSGRTADGFDTKIKFGSDGSMTEYNATRSIKQGGEDIGGMRFDDGNIKRYQDGTMQVVGASDIMGVKAKTDAMFDKEGKLVSANSSAGTAERLTLSGSDEKQKALGMSLAAGLIGDGHTKAGNDIVQRLKNGEAVDFNVARTQDGQLARVVGQHGGEFYNMDLSQTQHKRTKDMMDQSMAGYKATETINKENARTYEYKDPEAGSSRYFKAWGEMNTIGTGPNALKQMDLRKGMVQEVTKDGKPIEDGKASGDVFSGGVAIDGNRIINLEAESGTERQKKDVDKKIYDHMNEIKTGTSYNLGNDTLSMFMDNKPEVLAENYSDYFRGQSPTPGGRAMVDHVAKQMGGYGKIKQGVQDSLSASLKAGVNLQETFWGKVIGIEAGMSTEAQRKAIESIDADAVSIGMQNKYGDIMRQNKSDTWKMQQFTNFTNETYGLLNKNATQSTAAQMVNGADNVAKDGEGTPTGDKKREEEGAKVINRLLDIKKDPNEMPPT